MYFIIFILFLIENPLIKQCRPDQSPRSAASDLGLHCLPRSPAKKKGHQANVGY